ncbi:MAG: hypothetical protein ONB52_22010 [candidate division KSB1 bacterium]|nr:hypothetical protein [candidate division KSB1 bacterium]
MTLPAKVEHGSLVELLQVVVQKGGDLGAVESALRSFAEYEHRVREAEARERYRAAMAECHKQIGLLPAPNRVAIPTKRGGTYTFNYCDLATAIKVAGPVLAAAGFSWRWDYAVDWNTYVVTATCYLSHASGHTEQASFSCPVPDVVGEGARPTIHALSSARTAAARLAFLAVTGLVAAADEEPTESRVVKRQPKEPKVHTLPGGPQHFDGWGGRSLEEVPVDVLVRARDWLARESKYQAYVEAISLELERRRAAAG